MATALAAIVAAEEAVLAGVASAATAEAVMAAIGAVLAVEEAATEVRECFFFKSVEPKLFVDRSVLYKNYANFFVHLKDVFWVKRIIFCNCCFIEKLFISMLQQK